MEWLPATAAGYIDLLGPPYFAVATQDGIERLFVLNWEFLIAPSKVWVADLLALDAD